MRCVPALFALASSLLVPGAMFAGDEPGAAAYLGVRAVPVPDCLRAHLDLPPEAGLMIDGVDDHAPAANAGLRPCDVLVKLDEQLLIKGHQLATLIRTAAPGNAIQVTFIRKAPRQTVTIRLAECPARPTRDRRDPPQARPAHPRRPGRLFQRDVRRRMERWAEEMSRGLRHYDNEARRRSRTAFEDSRDEALGELHEWLKAFEKRLRESPKWLRENRPRQEWPRDDGPNAERDDEAEPPEADQSSKTRPEKTYTAVRMILRTVKYTVIVRQVDGKRTATVEDPDGKALHADVPQQKWDELPDEVPKLLGSVKTKVRGRPAAGMALTP